MGDKVEEVVGAKGKHDSDRVAVKARPRRG